MDYIGHANAGILNAGDEAISIQILDLQVLDFALNLGLDVENILCRVLVQVQLVRHHLLPVFLLESFYIGDVQAHHVFVLPHGQQGHEFLGIHSGDLLEVFLVQPISEVYENAFGLGLELVCIIANFNIFRNSFYEQKDALPYDLVDVGKVVEIEVIFLAEVLAYGFQVIFHDEVCTGPVIGTWKQ